MKKQKVKRINLELLQPSMDRIERLQSVLELRTMAQAIEKGLQALELLVLRTLEGEELFSKNKHTGEINRLIIMDLIPALPASGDTEEELTEG